MKFSPEQLRLIKAAVNHLVTNLTPDTVRYVWISSLVPPEDQDKKLRTTLGEIILELERLGEE